MQVSDTSGPIIQTLTVSLWGQDSFSMSNLDHMARASKFKGTNKRSYCEIKAGNKFNCMLCVKVLIVCYV